MINELIDKEDNFQLIGDQISAILLSESTSQQALATAAGKDPARWNFRVFREQPYPYESWLGSDKAQDSRPIISVTYAGSEFDQSSSNVGEVQKCTAQYNIDCYAVGWSKGVDGGGHESADYVATLEVQRVLSLARNILMAPIYTYLEMRGMVWQRWASAVMPFEKDQDEITAQAIRAGRIIMSVTFSEFTGQITGAPLEYVAVDVNRHETGELYFAAHYDYS